jgi:hypothetical protein
MAMVNILREWGSQPDIICDVCGDPIRYPDQPGYVLWNWWPGGRDGFDAAKDKPQPYLIVHQGRCDPGVPGHKEYELSQSLDEFIACTLNNTGLTPARLRRAARTAALLQSIR